MVSAKAEVWLLVDKQTKDVISMSPEDDAQLEVGWKKIMLPGKLIDYPLSYAPWYYKYQDNRFVVNIQKLSDEALAQEEAEEIGQEENEVRVWLRDYGITGLRIGGKVFKKIKKSDE